MLAPSGGPQPHYKADNLFNNLVNSRLVVNTLPTTCQLGKGVAKLAIFICICQVGNFYVFAKLAINCQLGNTYYQVGNTYYQVGNRTVPEIRQYECYAILLAGAVTVLNIKTSYDNRDNTQ